MNIKVHKIYAEVPQAQNGAYTGVSHARGGGGGGGTRLIWWTGVCRWNWWLFSKKSLNMGYGFAEKNP